MKNEKEQTKSKLTCLIYFLFMCVFFFCSTTYAQETIKFDSEAKKLEFIRKMLAQEKNLRSSEDNAQHCKIMMKDLLADKNFKAIEPDVRADSADDPRLAKWKKCEDEEISPLGFHYLSDLGGPPYRYYKIELDGNKKNGPEDMIYYNMYKEKIEEEREATLGRTGYTWVDGCETQRSYNIIGELQHWSRKPNAVYLNTLVYYKGILWAVEFVDGQGFSLYHWLDRGGQEACYWSLFKPEKIVK